MKITFTYQLVGSCEQHRLEIDPHDYFDPIEDDENYWDHGINKKLFLHEYLDINPGQIKWIVARLSKGNQTRIRRAQYLDGERVTMEHIINENREERIILGALVDSKRGHNIHLLKKHGRAWSVVYNSLDSDEVIDGKFESTDLCKQWTYEELEDFGKIQG